MKKSEIKKAITGILLGDSYLDTGHKFPRVELSQTAAHKEYIDLKANILRSVTGIKISEQLRTKKLNDKEYEYYRYTTNTHKYFAKYKWVHSGKITQKLLKANLSKEGFCYWVLDDGYMQVGRRPNGHIKQRKFDLFFMRYSVSELLEIAAFIKVEFDINFHLSEFKNRKSIYRFYLRASTVEDIQKLVVLLAPYTPECMRYKLDLEYKIDAPNLVEDYNDFLKNLPPGFFPG